MKNKLMKVLSLAMALTLVASLAACGGNNDDTTTTGAADTTAEDVVTPENPDAEVPSDETPVEETTVIVTDAEGHTSIVTQAPPKPGDKTTKPATPGKPNDPQKPADTGMEAPKNAAEAMKMFNDALGKTSVSGKMSPDNVRLGNAKAGSFDLKTLDGRVEPTFKSETSKKFNNQLFPINGATLNGTPSKSGDVITISFKLAPVNNTNAKYGDNGFAYFVTSAEAAKTVDVIVNTIGSAATALNIKIKSIDSIALTGTMDVKIDAKTGKIKSATYKFEEHLKGKASVKVFGTLGVDIVGGGTCTYTGK